MIHARIVITAGLALLIAGCGDSARTVEIERIRGKTREAQERIAKLEALQRDTDRAERWREQQSAWADEKLETLQALEVQRTNRIVEVESRERDLIRAILELRRSGAHGPPDVLPPSIEAEHTVGTVTLYNKGSDPLQVRLWRELTDGGERTFRHCQMEALERGADLMPGKALVFTKTHSQSCHGMTEETPIAIEVRRDGELVWLTDSLVHEVLRLPPEAAAELLKRAGGG